MTEEQALQEIQALKAKIEELQKRLDAINNTNPKKVPNE
jgi:prefoldin subunit 5